MECIKLQSGMEFKAESVNVSLLNLDKTYLTREKYLS